MQKKISKSKVSDSKKLLDIATSFPTSPEILASQEEQSFDIVNETTTTPNYDITYQLPKYYREKDQFDPNDLFVDFLQSYYDWLYSKNDGSEYPLTYSDFNKLMSGESDEFNEIKHFVFSYLAGFPEKKLRSNIIDVQNLKEFLKSIRTQFYQFKGNEQSFVYFFNSLYGVTAEDIQVNEPKTKVLRLNGGRFAGWASPVGTTGSYEEISSLAGSYLNQSVFRDSYFYQDFSYSVKIGKDPSEYSEVLLDILHPSGLLPFFETSIADYIPGETESDPTDESESTETPILYNYFAYSIDATGDLLPCEGCANNSYNTERHPPDGTTFDQPAFKHPGWALCNPTTVSDGRVYYDCGFSQINIGEFLYLSGINPNDEIAPCEDLDCPRVVI